MPVGTCLNPMVTRSVLIMLPSEPLRRFPGSREIGIQRSPWPRQLDAFSLARLIKRQGRVSHAAVLRTCPVYTDDRGNRNREAA